MLGGATRDALAPQAEAGGFHLAAHERDDLLFWEAKLKFDRLERGAVFPGHFDDAIEGVGVQFGQFHEVGNGMGVCG